MIGGADYIDFHFLWEGVFDLLEFSEKSPPIKTGHVNVKEDNVRKIFAGFLVVEQVIDCALGIVVNSYDAGDFPQFGEPLNIK